MFADAEVSFQITVDTKSGEASIKNISGQLQSIEKSSSSMSKTVASALGTVGSTLSSVGSSITTSVTLPITALGTATLVTATDFVKLKESSMIVFERMLGGADAAEELYQSLLAVAKGSTYSQETFLTAGKTLVGMGIDADTTVKYLQAATDAVSAFGGTATDIEEMTTVFGKMSMRGKVALDDIWSLSDKGVNALAILGNYYGLTTEEMQNMISYGTVPAEEALDALTDAMQNGSDGINGYIQGTAGMAAELKGGTLTGALDSLKSSFRNMAVEMWDAFENKDEMISAINAIGDAMGELPALIEPVTSAIGPALEAFAEKIRQITEFAKENPEAIGKIVTAIMKLAVAGPILLTLGKAFTTVSKTIQNVSTVGSVLSKLFSTFGLTLSGGVVAGILAAVAAFILLYNNSEAFRNLIGTIIETVMSLIETLLPVIETIVSTVISVASQILTAIMPIVDLISNFLATLLPIITTVITTILSVVVPVLTTIFNIISTYVSFVISFWSTIIGIITTVMSAIFSVISTVISSILSVIGAIASWIYENVLLPVFNFFSTVFSAIYNTISSFVSTVFSIFSTIASWVYNNVLSPIFNFFSSVFSTIWSVVSGVIEKIKSAFSTAANTVKTVFSNIKSFISNIFSTIAGIIKAPINGVINAINTVLKALNKIKIPDWVPGLGGMGLNFSMIPTLATGTNYVQSEGLAYLHKGEAVVPEKYNPAAGGYSASQPVYVTVNADMDVSKFGKAFVRDIKTFSGGAKNSYNYGGSK